jgi:hypothetical protein
VDNAPKIARVENIVFVREDSKSSFLHVRDEFRSVTALHTRWCITFLKERLLFVVSRNGKSRFGMQMQAYLGEEAARARERQEDFFQFVASLSDLQRSGKEKATRFLLAVCCVHIRPSGHTLELKEGTQPFSTTQN